jgi:hypothetical protein
VSISIFDLELPDLSADQPPAFTNAADCQKWQSEIPFTNARQAQAQLLRQINLLNRFNLPAEERLKVLEILREPTYLVHGECSVRFTSRPLPLAPPELAALETCQVLWQALEVGYLHCLKSFIDANPVSEAARRHVVVAATRALTSLLDMYLDDCRAGMLPAPLFWRHLHKIYRGIEKIQLSQMEIDDPLRHQSRTSVAAAYLETILVAAANPLELRPKQLNQVACWAQLWSWKIPILAAPPADLRTPPLSIDLVGDEHAVFKQKPIAADGIYWLDLAELRRTIKQRLASLAQGESPESLELGKDCMQPDCEILLKRVYQDWCRGGRSRTIQGGNGACQLVNGIEAIHYFLSGQVFREPKKSSFPGKREKDEMFNTGQRLARVAEDDEVAASYTIEDWHEINEDVTDILLQRPLAQSGKRLAKGQLVAVRTSSNDSLQIGKVHWVAVNAKRDTLLASVNTMPGPPVAATLHTEGCGLVKAQYCRGFLLPAIEGLGEPASVLTPAGWFQPDHVFDVQPTDSDTGFRIHVTRLIERGINFERCAYVASK